MGYALFTARKLMLQTRLNQMNYRLMVLSQQQQDMTQQVANEQMMSSFKTSAGSIFAYQQYDVAKQALSNNLDIKDYKDTNGNLDYAKLLKDVNDGKQGTKKLEQTTIDNDTDFLKTQLNEMTTKNQLQSQSDALKLQAVQTVGNQIDLEMKKLDSQIKETTAELEQVEKAEDTAIKNSAPKYGGGAGN